MEPPSRMDIVKGLGLPAAILVVVVVGRVTHDDVLAAVVTMVICGGYIAWWIWSNRFR
jgi:hypothetical protein